MRLRFLNRHRSTGQMQGRDRFGRRGAGPDDSAAPAERKPVRSTRLFVAH